MDVTTTAGHNFTVSSEMAVTSKLIGVDIDICIDIGIVIGIDIGINIGIDIVIEIGINLYNWHQ